MCGVAGILAAGACDPPDRGLLERMIRQVAHRGPDGYGFHVDGPVGLAHARLSIIDLAGGDQPIHNEDKTVWVVFNGEIFNYIELRQDLAARGHRFYTRSDTEVIVHAYEEYGQDFVRHLNGQFAIALWDDRRRHLVLARDRVGIRPLFYARLGGALLFASEAKCLFAHAAVQRRLNATALGELFTYWSVLPPATIFEGIYSLPPGHVLTAGEDGRVMVDCYWDWVFPDRGVPDARSLPEVVAGLREHLSRAVRLQVRADVPVGAYASGGLDSSVIIGLVKTLTQAPLHTFSLRFDDEEFDEGRFQRALVERYGTVHSELRVSRSDIGRALTKAVWHIESPILRTAPIPMMLLAGLVRRSGYKVVLTGEGADEVLAGYDLFREAKIRRFWAKDPQSRMRPALLRRLYPYLANSPATLSVYSARFFGEGIEHHQKPYFSHVPRWRTTQRAWRFFSGDLRRKLADIDPLARMERYLPPRVKGWRPLDRDQYIEAHTLLSGYILSSQGDRVAMANSVEGRVPFLDHHLIDYCNHLPVRYKIMGLNEKFALKELARELVPDAILERKKQPYRAPDSASFFACAESKALTEELLSPARLRDAGYFDVDAGQRLLAKCREGRAIGFADNMAFVGMISTMALDDLFVRGHGLSAPTSDDWSRSARGTAEPVEA